jgi:hypothetical protein
MSVLLPLLAVLHWCDDETIRQQQSLTTRTFQPSWQNRTAGSMAEVFRRDRGLEGF